MTAVFEKPDTIDRWDNDYYNPISLRLYDRAVPEMLRTMGAGSGDTVLDAGCGPGVHSIRAAKAGLNVVAIDISEAMLTEARRRAAQAGVADSIDFRRDDLTALQLPDASFDYVFSWGVVIHIPEAGAALDHLARVVRPGGKLALHLTNRHAFDHRFESLARTLTGRRLAGMRPMQLGDGVWYEMNGEPLWVWRMDARAVSRHLARHGFRLVARRTGELSELQRRFGGFPRRSLLRLNNLAYRVNLIPGWSATSISVYEKMT